MFGNHGLCGLPEEGAHEKSPKCLGGNLGDFGGILQRSPNGFARFANVRKVRDCRICLAQNERSKLSFGFPWIFSQLGYFCFLSYVSCKDCGCPSNFRTCAM